jgi:hypothetical protein
MHVMSRQRLDGYQPLQDHDVHCSRHVRVLACLPTVVASQRLRLRFEANQVNNTQVHETMFFFHSTPDTLCIPDDAADAL